VLFKFAEGSTIPATTWVQLGPPIGRVSIIPGLLNSILSVPRLNRDGYDVVMSRAMKCIIRSVDLRMMHFIVRDITTS
jgi:hypothetical protein